MADIHRKGPRINLDVFDGTGIPVTRRERLEIRDQLLLTHWIRSLAIALGFYQHHRTLQRRTSHRNPHQRAAVYPRVPVEDRFHEVGIKIAGGSFQTVRNAAAVPDATVLVDVSG